MEQRRQLRNSCHCERSEAICHSRESGNPVIGVVASPEVLSEIISIMGPVNIEKEKNIIARCLTGEKQAWDEFVAKYHKLVYNSIYRTLELTGYKIEPDLINDLYQEFFVSILNDDYYKLKKFKWKNGCSVATWLSVIARNMVLDFIRKNSKSKAKEESIDKETIDAEGKASLKDLLIHSEKTVRDELCDEEDVDRLQKIIEKLSAEDKNLLEMLYYQELSSEEIAVILNKSVDALYMQKKRLLEKLKEIAEKTC